MDARESITERYPLVSIVVPVHNHERFVVQTLDSVLAETWPRKELCIIDDGSSDRSPEIAQEWVESHHEGFERPIIFERQENSGISKTLNRAISRCNGEYILPLDSDDLLLPGSILPRIKFIREHPELKAVCADAQVIDDKGRLFCDSGIEDLYHGNKRKLADPRRLMVELLLNWSMPGSVIMYEKSSWRDICGYNEDLVVDDWDFCLRLAEKGWLGFLDTPVARYRVHEGNYSRQTASSESIADSLLRTARMSMSRLPWPMKIAAGSIAISLAAARIPRERHVFSILPRAAAKVLRQGVRFVFEVLFLLAGAEKDRLRGRRVPGEPHPGNWTEDE